MGLVSGPEFRGGLAGTIQSFAETLPTIPYEGACWLELDNGEPS